MSKPIPMKVEIWPLDKIKPYGKNPRKAADHAIEFLAKGIERFGFRNPIQVDGDGVIIAGHTRLQAARKLGLKTAPVLQHKDIDEGETAALRIADNKLAELTEWDMALLFEEFEGINADSPELMGFMGFSDQEIGQILGGPSDGTDPLKEWKGMPEFDADDKTGYHSIRIHFADAAAVDAFAKLIGQKIIVPSTRFVWYPEAADVKYVDKVYA